MLFSSAKHRSESRGVFQPSSTDNNESGFYEQREVGTSGVWAIIGEIHDLKEFPFYETKISYKLPLNETLTAALARARAKTFDFFADQLKMTVEMETEQG